MRTTNSRKPVPFELVPELKLLQSPSIRLAPNFRVPFTRQLQDLVDHPLFQRLRGVKQLGFVDRVYPDATHTRFAHSLGVFNQAIYYVHALWRDPTNSWFSETMQQRELRSVLVAALFHDLGQYPFSHVFEDTERLSDGFLPDSIFDHEKYTLQLLLDKDFRQEFASSLTANTPDLVELLADFGVSPEEVAAVLTGDEASGVLRPGAASVLHSIIDGPLDADKLDYLQRDSHHSGVNFGRNIDVHRLYEALTVRQKRAGDHWDNRIAVTQKGRVPAEEVLIARGHMFTEVYWHRTVRAHEAVLATVIRRLRPMVEGFDAWFRNAVLATHSSDEWFLEEFNAILCGKRNDVVRLAEESQTITVIEECRQMLYSVNCSKGRHPFKRLLSVSAREHPGLYEALQNIRDVAYSANSVLLEELGREFSDRIRSHFSERVNPLELVFDIPARRSPANDVWVISTDPAFRGEAMRLSEHSSMWGEYAQSFHDESRRIRVFCRERTRELIRNRLRGDESKLMTVFNDAALTVARIAVQLELPLS